MVCIYHTDIDDCLQWDLLEGTDVNSLRVVTKPNGYRDEKTPSGAM